MSFRGTDAYSGLSDLPALVATAVDVAKKADFPLSCVPAHGELLRVLARGIGPGLIGETGTGCGVGLAWLASGAHPDARLVSVERDPFRAALAAAVFADHPTPRAVSRPGSATTGRSWPDAVNGPRSATADRPGPDATGGPQVEVIGADWRELRGHGPFDLLVLDGGGQGKKGEPPIDPAQWLRPGGMLVIDDFTPSTGWPPTYAGEVDNPRLYWLTHPLLRAAEVRVTPDLVTIVASYPG
ncbi:transferase [Longispora fulva]|uniref:Putative O-methyltransferase YrrM n=1 Tax=Longispora fulva TaxID=619741 RepID=A0A8J7GWB1_9ACTN|nr:class I SAM-dependent methyltransferase [Longispora fulva]MBG6138811.1 putative O-methyltransferase YrrM [Longispora fulva]GIG58306.1 transferase [Longispora fulva]